MFRVAHLSDLHLLSLRGVRPWSFLGKRLLGGANLLASRAREFSVDVARRLIADVNAQQVDHVVVSGDLTNLSLRAEFELARDVLAQLALPPSEITVIPGNHDCYTWTARWADDFGRLLAPYLRGDDGAQSWPVVRARGSVVVIGLSTARPSAPLLAVGTLGAGQRERLERALRAHESRFRLVAVHHPPTVPPAHWHNRLTDGADLVALLGRAGAELVVHGHLHRRVDGALSGPRGEVPVVGVTSSTWLARDIRRRAAYHIYEIEQQMLRRTRVRCYDVERQVFAEA